MSDIQEMLERQAQWQEGRKALTWPEKIRMAERIRESARQLRAGFRHEVPGAVSRLRNQGDLK
jgi:hypothetical protein